MANELKPKKGAVVTEINGVKYFKLQSNYPGDYTKNCGLLGNEIDENFYFLRSNDIDTMSFEDGILTLTRVDGDVLSADINMPYTFEFDKEEGKLIITDYEGNVQELDGFIVEYDAVKIASDATLDGNGTKYNPLKLSELEKTGTYAPAKELRDLTNGGSLPDGASLGQGYRIVSKEKVDNFGLMYNYDGVSAIQMALDETGSLWRVPSRKDWADLLNAAEYCDEDRNHDITCVNEWTGKNAGARAKSLNLWKPSSSEEGGLPVGGEDNLPNYGDRTFRIYPLGDGDGSRGAKDDDYDIEAFSKRASFWTLSPTNCADGTLNCASNIFTRTFNYDTRMVLQESSKPSSRMSLRLVKDYEPGLNISEFDNILGYSVPCVLISNDDTQYSKVWTAVNVGFGEPQFSGVTSQQWSAATGTDRGIEVVYFINEWDGRQWFKKPMREGDSIVIIDGGLDESGETIYNHEWRVYSGETEPQLIDTAEAAKEEFQEEIDALNEKVDEFSAATVAEFERVEGKIDAETERAEAAEQALDTKINAETERATAAEQALDAKIDAETERAEAAEQALDDKINAEIERATAAENSISGTVNTFSAATVAEIERLDSKIDAETERAEAAENSISGTVNTFSAATVAEIERLDGKDITDDNEGIEYEMSIDGLVLRRENGGKINIVFNGNFGTNMPEPLN